MDDIKTFVALKYQIITAESRNPLTLCGTYPVEVRVAWSRRCAADVEHLSKGHISAERAIIASKKYKDGLINLDELEEYAVRVSSFGDSRAPYHAANSALHAAVSKEDVHVSFAAIASGQSVNSYAAVVHAVLAASLEESHGKWNLYTNWLFEELCKWESTHG